MSKDKVLEIKTNVEQLTATYDKLFAMCLRQLKPATCHTKQEVMQRVIERNNLIKALESYLAAKGESNDK
jgi:hypothetical protein